MLQLVWRHLSFDLARTGLTTMAIAAVVAVILVLEGFNEGFAAQPGNTVMDKGAGLIITQAGVSNIVAARSVLPQMSRLEVESLPGVAVAHRNSGHLSTEWAQPR